MSIINPQNENEQDEFIGLLFWGATLATVIVSAFIIAHQ